MAVYTHISHDDVTELLARYDVGTLVLFEGIVTGVENSNYLITTDQNKFILTIFEKRVDPRDLPFFFAYMNHLAKQKIDVPQALRDQNGDIIHTMHNKKCVLISFLNGTGVTPAIITPDLCAQMGELSARLHVGAITFDSSRPNTMGLNAWKKLYQKMKYRLHEIDMDAESIVRAQLLEFENTTSLNLPRAVVHADLFPDNIFIDNGNLSGVIDFYFSCNDYLGYDVALTMNAWCFDQNGECDHERLVNFITSYELIRPISPDEKRFMNLFFRMAALRIFMTRAHDWLFHDETALVKPKDPREYLRILNYHCDHTVLG
jgi:homoserine kinase type II